MEVINVWNNRPIEDQLRAENEKLNRENQALYDELDGKAQGELKYFRIRENLSKHIRVNTELVEALSIALCCMESFYSFEDDSLTKPEDNIIKYTIDLGRKIIAKAKK